MGEGKGGKGNEERSIAGLSKFTKVKSIKNTFYSFTAISFSSLLQNNNKEFFFLEFGNGESSETRKLKNPVLFIVKKF